MTDLTARDVDASNLTNKLVDSLDKGDTHIRRDRGTADGLLDTTEYLWEDGTEWTEASLWQSLAGHQRYRHSVRTMSHSDGDVSITFRSDNDLDKREMIAYTTKELARKLRDELNAMDLDDE